MLMKPFFLDFRGKGKDCFYFFPFDFRFTNVSRNQDLRRSRNAFPGQDAPPIIAQRADKRAFVPAQCEVVGISQEEAACQF